MYLCEKLQAKRPILLSTGGTLSEVGAAKTLTVLSRSIKVDSHALQHRISDSAEDVNLTPFNIKK